jgi:uncharacterized protein
VKGRIKAVALAPGEAQGKPLALDEPLSFWGGLDVETGRIIDRHHPQCGESVSGRVLIMSAGRGSSSGSAALAEALRRGVGPAAIILGRRDGIVIVGALVAAELYGVACPVVLLAAQDWGRIAGASSARIVASETLAEIVSDDLPA